MDIKFTIIRFKIIIATAPIANIIILVSVSPHVETTKINATITLNILMNLLYHWGNKITLSQLLHLRGIL